jgi:hypothetical protein
MSLCLFHFALSIPTGSVKDCSSSLSVALTGHIPSQLFYVHIINPFPSNHFSIQMNLVTLKLKAQNIPLRPNRLMALGNIKYRKISF